jgi:hypothetical protein
MTTSRRFLDRLSDGNMPLISEPRRRGPMLNAIERAAFAALLLMMGCASSGPTYEQIESTLPPLAAGQGRIYLFLTGATEIPSFFPQLTVDGAPVGELRPNTYLYVDRPEGVHVVGVGVKKVDAAFGAQGATTPLEIPLEAGETVYVETDATADGMVVVTLTRVPAEDGQRDLRPLSPAPQPSQ